MRELSFSWRPASTPPEPMRNVLVVTYDADYLPAVHLAYWDDHRLEWRSTFLLVRLPYPVSHWTETLPLPADVWSPGQVQTEMKD